LTIEWNVRSGRCDKDSKNGKDGKGGFSRKNDSNLVLPEQRATPNTLY